MIIMTDIQKANIENIEDIQQIAKRSWPIAFADILPPQQIEYMMEMMYSTAALKRQIEELNHKFYIATVDNKKVGYISVEHNCDGGSRTKIHKLYLLPEYQKMGVGYAMYLCAARETKKQGNKTLCLNVNKYNHRAIDFYKRAGFELMKEEVIDIGNGYVMDDYVFEIDIEKSKL